MATMAKHSMLAHCHCKFTNGFVFVYLVLRSPAGNALVKAQNFQYQMVNPIHVCWLNASCGTAADEEAV